MTPNDPAVFLLMGAGSKSKTIAALPLSSLVACNPAAHRRQAAGGSIKDLSADDHVAVQSSSRLIMQRLSCACKISIVMYEPPAVQPRHYASMAALFWRFHRVLTYTPALLRLPNAACYNMHSAWVEPTPAPSKTKSISLISSAKRDLAGHRLRLKIAELHKDKLDLFGRAFTPLERKNQGLDAYRFSVAVENSRSNGYISEKVLDCFLTKTVPIYWGAGDIGQHFNLDGIITCRTQNDISNAIENVSTADYAARAKAIEENYHRALKVSDIKARLNEALLG